ncbi:DUF2357 domain-containing protein [Clostridium bowmanii]|uniref:DUF2357 domain-containing protein n=1 Tax=Clostridium bowmanii TaxID=132925 RepID=UPI001CD3BFBD|nr:DUF2357 domain-containing protein [Clostridium bowmanii]MCA1073422.1 DUF2357 domain-containing protein [Clostridium bowmanii]
MNFRGDIGYSDLYVNINGKPHMKIIIEVLPSKIEYKEDYEAILRDVNEEIYNLAYGFLSRTYLETEINNKRANSYTEFYSILNYVYERLIKAINIVLLKPHHELIKDSGVCKYQSLKNISMDTIKIKKQELMTTVFLELLYYFHLKMSCNIKIIIFTRA